MDNESIVAEALHGACIDKAKQIRARLAEAVKEHKRQYDKPRTRLGRLLGGLTTRGKLPDIAMQVELYPRVEVGAIDLLAAVLVHDLVETDDTEEQTDWTIQIRGTMPDIMGWWGKKEPHPSAGVNFRASNVEVIRRERDQVNGSISQALRYFIDPDKGTILDGELYSRRVAEFLQGGMPEIDSPEDFSLASEQWGRPDTDSLAYLSVVLEDGLARLPVNRA